MKKSFSILDLVFLAFTRHSFLIYGLCVGNLLSCQTATENSSEPQSDNMVSEQEDLDLQQQENIEENSETKEIELLNELTHPRYATREETRFYLLSNLEGLDEEKLNTCRMNLDRLSSISVSRDDFLANRQRLIEEIRSSVKFYHYCFYFTIMKLEEELYQDKLGNNLEETHLLFYKKIRGLMLLSVSIGNILGTNKYFDFLRIRYVDLSYLFFGRKLQILDGLEGEPEVKGKPAKEL